LRGQLVESLLALHIHLIHRHDFAVIALYEVLNGLRMLVMASRVSVHVVSIDLRHAVGLIDRHENR
jgi:hypothetical protein